MNESRTDFVFKRYVDANGLKRVPDFPNNRTLYETPNGKKVTRENLADSQAFAGFVDGFEGHPP